MFDFQIANTMKKSDHLWLKIASKWASDEPTTPTSTSTSKPTTPSLMTKAMPLVQAKTSTHFKPILLNKFSLIIFQCKSLLSA